MTTREGARSQMLRRTVLSLLSRTCHAGGFHQRGGKRGAGENCTLEGGCALSGWKRRIPSGGSGGVNRCTRTMGRTRLRQDNLSLNCKIGAWLPTKTHLWSDHPGGLLSFMNLLETLFPSHISHGMEVAAPAQ